MHGPLSCWVRFFSDFAWIQECPRWKKIIGSIKLKRWDHKGLYLRVHKSVPFGLFLVYSPFLARWTRYSESILGWPVGRKNNNVIPSPPLFYTCLQHLLVLDLRKKSRTQIWKENHPLLTSSDDCQFTKWKGRQLWNESCTTTQNGSECYWLTGIFCSSSPFLHL